MIEDDTIPVTTESEDMGGLDVVGDEFVNELESDMLGVLELSCDMDPEELGKLLMGLEGGEVCSVERELFLLLLEWGVDL